MRWALNGLYQTGLGDRVYGPTLMLRLCDRAAQTKLPIYLYGSRPEVLEALQNRLQKKFPALVIAGTKPSQFRQISDVEQDTVLKSIRDSGARIVFVGLGCPRQEIWAYEVRDRLGIPAIAVGAAFDFHAGLLPQAPTWMQRSGLEWLFRLIQEPKRLWQRYLVFNSLYVLGFNLQYLRLKAFQPQPLPNSPAITAKNWIGLKLRKIFLVFIKTRA